MKTEDKVIENKAAFSPNPKRGRRVTSESTINQDYAQGMSFYQALKRAAEGKNISRLQWSKQDYGFFDEEGVLCFKQADGKKHEWLVSRADVEEDDWFVISRAN